MKKVSMVCADGTPVSQIALGTLYFGSKIPQAHCNQLLETFFAMGGNQIDTARSYADWLPNGASASERAIGQWLSDRDRKTAFLATKGGLKPRGYNATRGDLSRENMERDLKQSLQALGTDYVDLYWLHRDDWRYTPGEIVKMMNDWIRQGVIRYFGVSNWHTDRIRQANAYAEEHDLQGISASQIQYGLGVCTTECWGDGSIVCMDEAEYKEYQSMQLPVYAYSAQAEGYFSLYLREKSLSEDTRKKYDTVINRRRASKLVELVDTKGISLTWIMAEYVLESSFPGVFILGGSNLERMKEIMEKHQQNVRQLTKEDWKNILT